MQVLATAITKIFNPAITSLATIAVAVWVQEIATAQKMLWLILGLFVATVPMAVLYLQYKRGQLSSLWSPSALERRDSYIAWVVTALSFSLLAFWLAAPRLILALGLVFLVLGVVNLLATASLKISVHSELITTFVMTAILTVSVSLIYLAVLILLVAWARLRLKAHSVSEVSFGTMLAILVVYFVFSVFGLATF